jgi:hypothetical protein
LTRFDRRHGYVSVLSHGVRHSIWLHLDRKMEWDMQYTCWDAIQRVNREGEGRMFM